MIKKVINHFIEVALLILIIGFPFPYYFFSIHTKVINFVASKSFLIVQKLFYPIGNLQLQSDSIGLIIWLLMLLFVALLVTIFIYRKDSFFSKLKEYSVFKTFIIYFVCLHLLKYGFDKIFLVQFQTPSAIVRDATLGSLDKDILYWSAIGSSASYNLFLGGLEVLCACLLLHSKTRFFGLLMAFAILLNIVAVNFCFGIEVKIFSCLLLVLIIYLLFSYKQRLFNLFNASPTYFVEQKSSKSNFVKALHGMVFFSLFAEALMPHFKNLWYQNTHKEKHQFSEVYRVIYTKKALDTSATLLLFDHIYFHKNESILFFKNGHLKEEYPYLVNTISNKIYLQQKDNSLIDMPYTIKMDSLFLQYSTGTSFIEICAIVK